MKICEEYNVDCEVDIQGTKCFDFNAPDAGIHSVLKGGVRNLLREKCVDHIKRDIDLVGTAMQNNNPRTIQDAFVRAYGQDMNGEINQSLIPAQILDWYEKRWSFRGICTLYP